jgi:hypothetical protein
VSLAEVPDELVANAVDAWHAAGDMLLDDVLRSLLAAVLPEIQAHVLEEAATTVAREVGVVWPSQRHADVGEAASYAAEVLRANARAAREGKPAPYAARPTTTTETDTTSELARLAAVMDPEAFEPWEPKSERHLRLRGLQIAGRQAIALRHAKRVIEAGLLREQKYCAKPTPSETPDLPRTPRGPRRELAAGGRLPDMPSDLAMAAVMADRRRRALSTGPIREEPQV